ncbi:hypothetical protein OJ253_3682 [Cryptosporidium canis]|uniref:Uncharacterized protein n=1 Tax=Cryptosporidium canis TaxID=195482 RepID=A0A9D5HVR7_9CRYT|nr:hypothetical protein OJ253_3682 [Cryptosporidium canis]
MKELWNGFEIEFTGLPNNPATKVIKNWDIMLAAIDDHLTDSATVHFGPVDGDPEEVDLPPGHIPGQHRHREPAASGVQEVPDGGWGGAGAAQEVSVQTKGHRSRLPEQDPKGPWGVPGEAEKHVPKVLLHRGRGPAGDDRERQGHHSGPETLQQDLCGDHVPEIRGHDGRERGSEPDPDPKEHLARGVAGQGRGEDADDAQRADRQGGGGDRLRLRRTVRGGRRDARGEAQVDLWEVPDPGVVGGLDGLVDEADRGLLRDGGCDKAAPGVHPEDPLEVERHRRDAGGEQLREAQVQPADR